MLSRVSNDELNIVHRRDGSFSGRIFCETDEPEATAATGVSILHHDLLFVRR